MKYLDYDGLKYFAQQIKGKLNNKVDKVTGKGLSTNDYTTAEKNKLAGIASDANKTTVEDLLTSTSTTNALSAKQGKVLNDKIESINGVASGKGDMLKATYDADGDGVVDNAKALNGHEDSYFAKATDIPTKTSQLTNDSSFTTMSAVEKKGYQTASQVTSAITTAIAGVTQFDMQVVENLPTTGKKGVIYLISHAHGTNDSYDEYIWVTNGSTSNFEKLGNTDINLSEYVKTTDLVSITNTEIDAIINA
jgi:hypothetical protein